MRNCPDSMPRRNWRIAPTNLDHNVEVGRADVYISLNRTGHRSSNSGRILLWICVLLNALLLLVPKLVLVEFVNEKLWGGIALGSLPGAIAQDVLVAGVASMMAFLLIRKANPTRIFMGMILIGSVLLVLMLDMRVRQLWLKPTDLALLRYVFDNASHLTSGYELFFNNRAVYSLTFRRLLFLVGLSHFAIWGLIAWVALRPTTRFSPPPALWRTILPLLICAGAAAIVAVFPTRYIYRTNENPVVAAAFNAIRSAYTTRDRSNDSSQNVFEQPTRPLSDQLKLKRTVFANVPSFKNVVVVVYESVRWRDFGLENPKQNSAFPNLSRMAAEGFVSKSYVSVPHSSKAYFAILSGRHPFPGIEMREALDTTHDSIWNRFSRERNGTIFAISSLFLGFENMGGLIRSLGIDEVIQAERHEASRNHEVAQQSSFGTSDDLLIFSTPLGQGE